MEPGLTPREKECMTWIANGKTAIEISIILGISKTTVTTHLECSKRKLGASNISHAVAIAMKGGIIDIHTPAFMLKQANEHKLPY